MRSEQLADLTAALVTVQHGLTGAAKSASNPHLKNQYSTLADVWDACRALLTANGLAVVQSFNGCDDSGISLTTTLLHTSGQWIASELRMPLEKPTAQAVGSAITYARRYGLAALVGVVPMEDDDGNAATQAAPPAARKAAKKAAPAASSGPRAPWTIREEGGLFIALGEGTFTAKDELKALGFRWDAKEKKWYTDSRDIAVKAAALGGFVKTLPAAPVPAASGDDDLPFD